MEHRDGRKFGGEHGSLIDLAAEISDMLQRLPETEKISPGFIKMGIGNGRGRKSVKIIDEAGCVLLKIKQSSSYQEVRIFTKNRQSLKLQLAKWLRNNGINISFNNTQED